MKTVGSYVNKLNNHVLSNDQQFDQKEQVIKFFKKYINNKNLSKTKRSMFASIFTFDNLEKWQKNINSLREISHDFVLNSNLEGGENNNYDNEIGIYITIVTNVDTNEE